MEQSFFRPIQEGYPGNMPRELNYVNSQGHRVNVVFGTEFGHPATRYSITDATGRLIREGGSFAVSFDHALSASLGPTEGLVTARVLRQSQQEQINPGEGLRGRV